VAPQANTQAPADPRGAFTHADNSKKRSAQELLCDKTFGKRQETSHNNFARVDVNR